MRPATLDGDWDLAFRASPYWMRFELGGEIFGNIDQPVPRFIQAFHRAQTVANAVFAMSSPLTAVIAAPTEPQSDFFAPVPDAFRALGDMGFRSSAAWSQWLAPLYPGDVDSVTFTWRAIDLDDPIMRDTLLWASIVYEMSISPKAPILTWLVDFAAGVMLHVYDDRGMDLHAIDRGTIAPFYRGFDAWLLDYDRPRMNAAFEQ